MVDIKLLEEIFVKKAEGQTLSVEEEEVIDDLNAPLKTDGENLEKLSDEAIDKNNPLSGVALVCTKAKNGIAILYEFKDVGFARIIAKKIMQEEF